LGKAATDGGVPNIHISNHRDMEDTK